MEIVYHNPQKNEVAIRGLLNTRQQPTHEASEVVGLAVTRIVKRPPLKARQGCGRYSRPPRIAR